MGKAITQICFQRCQDIAPLAKIFYLFCTFIEITIINYNNYKKFYFKLTVAFVQLIFNEIESEELYLAETFTSYISAPLISSKETSKLLKVTFSITRF